MAQLLVYFALLYQALLLMSAGQTQQLTTAATNRTRGEAVRTVAAAVDRYATTNGTYPASLAALANTDGYEFLQSSVLPWQEYAVASNLNDGVWTFSRATVYTQDSGTMIPAATYLATANNDCGTGPFATAADWCAKPNTGTYYWRHETRETINLIAVRERQRLKRLLDKFARYYNEHGAFPNPGSAAATLATLTAYAGNATSCTTVSPWSNIPFDCTDLYSKWGTPTTYNYISATHIALLTQSTMLRFDGEPLYVSMELAL